MLSMKRCPEIHAHGRGPALVPRWPALGFLEQRWRLNLWGNRSRNQNWETVRARDLGRLCQGDRAAPSVPESGPWGFSVTAASRMTFHGKRFGAWSAPVFAGDGSGSYTAAGRGRESKDEIRPLILNVYKVKSTAGPRTNWSDDNFNPELTSRECLLLTSASRTANGGEKFLGMS